jgi:hypothetical protein
MPFVNEYRDSEVFMVHNGVTIYHVYKDNDPDQGCREFWFDADEDSQEESGFDIRDLAHELGMRAESAAIANGASDNIKMSVLRRAIDAKLVGSPKD